MIVVCGEALVDLVGEPADGPGQVYHATNFCARPGGSPANVAVGLARLGTPSALLCRLSDDGFGRLLRAHVAGAGVDLRYAVPAAEPTTLALAALDPLGRAEYSFYVNGCADGAWSAADLPTALPEETAVIHVSGSLALGTAAMGDVLETLIERESGRRCVVLDPNVRPDLARDEAAVRARWDRWLGSATVVKASEDDVAWLAPGTPLEDVAARWLAAGPSLVVVTRGGDGAYARTAAGEAAIVSEPVDLVDTVGAGDAFAAGLIDHLRRQDLLSAERLSAAGGAALTAAMRWAGHVAALTCARAGADPPTRLEADATFGPALP